MGESNESARRTSCRKGSDLWAILGFSMVFAGALLFKFGAYYMALWLAWLVAPLFWYLGFAILVAWVLARIFLSPSETSTETSNQFDGNFVEHNIQTETGKGDFMKATVAVLLAAAFILVVFSGPVSAQDVTAGKDLFAAKCAMCHGADASANTPMGKNMKIPNLRSSEVQKQSNGDLATTIAKGKNKMPAFDGKLTATQINQVVVFIKSLK